MIPFQESLWKGSKKMKKTLAISIILTLFSNIFAFDWPSAKVDSDKVKFDSDKITTYFAQKTGTSMGTFITLKETEEVQCSDNGNPLIILEDFNDDTDFFPSALGSAVIMRHDDNLISVYSHLDKDTITASNYDIKLAKHEQIAKTGKSGFVKEENTLGFQIIDVKEKKAINPLLLLPQPATIPALSISNIIIKNKNGVAYDMQWAKAFMAGTYKIYFKRNELAVPFTTSVLINGEQTDEISYNSLNQEDGKCNVSGKRNYSNAEIYPDDKLMLAGEAILKQGKATITLIFTDLKGNSRQLNYSVTVH